jgi:hypothetical protein
VPGEASGNLTAIMGGPEITDSNGNKQAPVVTMDFMTAAVANQKAFSATTGQIYVATALTGNMTAFWFVPNTNTKNIIVHDIEVAMFDPSNIVIVNTITSKPTLTAAANMVITGRYIGSSSSMSASNMQYDASHVYTPVGTALGLVETGPAGSSVRVLFKPLYIPASTAFGIQVFWWSSTGFASYGVTVHWLEL